MPARSEAFKERRRERRHQRAAESHAREAALTAPLRAADVLAQRLYEAGCRYAFGMPGGEVLTVVDALEKAGIRFVLAKHQHQII